MATRKVSAAVVLYFALVALPSVYAQDSDAGFDNGEGSAAWFAAQRMYPLGFIPKDAIRLAHERMTAQERTLLRRNGQSSAGTRQQKSQTVPTWTLIGPTAIRESSFIGRIGRIEAIALDPQTPGTIYVGGGGGGVWKTGDGGKSWASLTDAIPAPGIGSLAIDPSHPKTIYVGTGDPFGAFGIGILKSTDGGDTWTDLAGPFGGPGPGSYGGSRINSISVNPANTQVLLAAARGAVYDTFYSGFGLFRSADGGQTWSNVMPNVAAAQVVFDPGGSIAYASIDLDRTPTPQAAIYRSTDSGLTWHPVNGTGANTLPTNAAGLLQFGVAPSNSNIVYASVQTPGGVFVYKSTDSGANWAKLANTPQYCGNNGHSGCDYANAIAVSPSNPDVVYLCGVDAFRSLDGGTTWQNIDYGNDGQGFSSGGGDHHALAFVRDGSALFTGNDLGLFSLNDPAGETISWRFLGEGLALAQFYPHFSIDPNSGVIFGGSQDNGYIRYTGSTVWELIHGGDGGWMDFSPNNSGSIIAGEASGNIYKSVKNGDAGTWVESDSGISLTDLRSFIPPLVADPSSPQRAYFGTNHVYQTTDGAASWKAISGDLGNGVGALSALAVAPSNPNVIYAGLQVGLQPASQSPGYAPIPQSMPLITVATNALGGGIANWSNRSTGLPRRFVTNISVDPANSLSAYVTFSGFTFGQDTLGHVFKTVNGGNNWTDISGNLPNLPANDLLIDPDLPSTLYLATDLGVFVTSDGGGSWAPLGQGLPRAVVTALGLFRPTRSLYAATYGHSMWVAQLAGPTSPFIKPNGVAPIYSSSTAIEPGSWVWIFGSNLSQTTRSWNSATEIINGHLPTSLDGVSVSINNKPAYVYYVSPGQISVQAPDDTTTGPASVVVTNAAGTSNPVTVTLGSAGPSFFTYGDQYALGVIPSTTGVYGPGSYDLMGPSGRYSFNTRPVKVGEVVSLYGTGFGATNPPTPAGVVISPPYGQTAPVTVSIGGVSQTVNAYVTAAGEWQINVTIPNLPTGDQPLKASVGGLQSPANVFVTIQ